MATTTNYGWTTPDDTALVKDGASAIRTLGSSVDTTVKNLNPETTLGDISYRSSTANTNTRLALGTAGQVLTVNSGATAPEWQTIAANSMTLITSTTASASASVNFTSIPSTYNNLMIVIRNFKPSVDGAALIMRFNNDSTANRYISSLFSNVSEAAQTFSRSSMVASEANDNSVANGIITTTIFDYKNTSTWKITQLQALTVDNTTTTSLRYPAYISAWNQTSAISEVNFLPTSGNITSGDFLLYGVK